MCTCLIKYVEECGEIYCRFFTWVTMEDSGSRVGGKDEWCGWQTEDKQNGIHTHTHTQKAA